MRPGLKTRGEAFWSTISMRSIFKITLELVIFIVTSWTRDHNHGNCNWLVGGLLVIVYYTYASTEDLEMINEKHHLAVKTIGL